jgi:quinoprotein glucose dehydrogenase
VKRRQLSGRVGVLAAAVFLTTTYLGSQSGAVNTEWRTYGGDLKSTRYAPVDQINATNFNEIDVAWRFKTDNLGPAPEFNLQSTPLVVDGVLYSTAGARRSVVALDAATGEIRWVHGGEQEGKRGESAPRRLSGRGLAYWSDAREARVLYVTPGYRLIALDARTGAPIRSFGTDGAVDLKRDNDQVVDPITGEVGLQAAPVVVKDTIIIGAAHANGLWPRSRQNVKGYVRGYDVRTGRRLWIFHTIPKPGQFGYDTWQGDAANYSGNTGVWGQVTVDESLGLAYLPVESPTNDHYGGHRVGDGLFGDSLVAIDVATGRRRWHYQLIHHSLWDWDPPCAPILADLMVNGRAIKAVAVPTKQGWVYVFDRATGAPVWPIEERAVPQSDVPGERTSPTQPFPTRPPAFERQGIRLEDLIDFTPELRAQAIEVASRYRMGPLFTPPVASKAGGPLATLMVPGTSGGANWGGGSLDQETNYLYLFSSTQVSTRGLVQDPKRSDMDWIEGTATSTSSASASSSGAAATRGEGGEAVGGISVQGLPLVKPPWGRITAIDLNKGEIAWQVPHGDTADNVRNHPLLKGLSIPRTGRPGRLGVLTTKSLVIAGESGFVTTPSGKRGAMLRAYDKATGKEVGAVYLPAPQTGSPMTYVMNGRQYIVVAVSGAGYSGELIAFRLPS